MRMLDISPVNMRQWSVMLVSLITGLTLRLSSGLVPSSSSSEAGLHQNSTSGIMKLLDWKVTERQNYTKVEITIVTWSIYIVWK